MYPILVLVLCIVVYVMTSISTASNRSCLLALMWFNGPITEAISNAKKRNTILIVFVQGSDNIETYVSFSPYYPIFCNPPSTRKEDDSRLALETWENDDVQSVCVKNACIALKLDKESIEARQFAEFYPLISIPISFLINGEGVALDVVVDPVSPSQLKERVQNCLQKLKGQSNAVTEKTETKEEKVEKAKELIKQVEKSKENAAQESEREKELQRREDGKSMLTAREKQKEMEMLAAAEERKQEKQADREYLKKLREQIAADRTEKSAKYQCHKDEGEEERKKKMKTAAEAKQALTEAEIERLHSKARIQFRLPGGDEAPLIEEFDSNAKFSTAYDFVSLNLHLKQNFHLIQMYPRREFTVSDSNKTFRQLDLTPSAVLLILEPGKNRSSSSVQTYQGNWISYTFSILFLPIVTIYNMLYNFVFPPNVNRNNAAQNINNARQDSNTRRLNDGRRDNDDNATWNGNSTQQL